MAIPGEVALQELGSASGKNQTANATEPKDHDGFLDRSNRAVQAIEGTVDHRQHLADQHLVVLEQRFKMRRLCFGLVEDPEQFRNQVR